jgi:hypothetical protein
MNSQRRTTRSKSVPRATLGGWITTETETTRSRIPIQVGEGNIDEAELLAGLVRMRGCRDREHGGCRGQVRAYAAVPSEDREQDTSIVAAFPCRTATELRSRFPDEVWARADARFRERGIYTPPNAVSFGWFALCDAHAPHIPFPPGFD